MIIDSHAHYAYPRFDAETPYLSERDGKFTVLRGNREDVLAEMQKNGIIGVIEPSIGFNSSLSEAETVNLISLFFPLVDVLVSFLPVPARSSRK